MDKWGGELDLSLIDRFKLIFCVFSHNFLLILMYMAQIALLGAW